MDAPGTLEEMLAKGRRPYGLARCRVFERDGDFMETSPFGWRVHPATGERRFHAGVDGAVWTGSALGESWIVAPLAGVVAAAEDGVDGFSRERPAGNFVELDHGGGLRTRYLHLERGTVRVRAGDRVFPGDRLGYMGKSGLATGEHLHFELLRDGKPVDPAPFLREPPAGADGGRERLLARLRASVPEKRYVHSLGVADAAVRLARLHGADEARAELAGFLHDCAKGIPVDEQVAACDRLGVPLDDWTRACPPVVHGELGAFLARRDYGVEDEAVLQAIRRHTVGAPGMTLLDKVVFVADLVEPGRAFEGVEELRALADRDLDEAILVSIERQLALNAARRRPLHPATLLVWNELLAARRA